VTVQDIDRETFTADWTRWHRQHEAKLADPHGAVTLDFNRAVNLPCAYTEFATCPLPPPENRLPVAVEAGEMIPFDQNERWFHSHGTE